MTEILLKTIRFEKTPRVPAAVLDGYLWMIRRAGLSFQAFCELDARKAAQLVLDTYNLLGSDIVYDNSAASGAMREAMGGASDFTRIGEPVAAVKNPMNQLSESGSYNASEIFSKLMRHPHYQTMLRQLEYLCAECSEEEKPVAAFSPAPLTLAASFCGVQELMSALYEDESAVHTALDLSSELCIKTLKCQAEHGADILSMADPVASVSMLSTEFFEIFALPYIKRVTSELKNLGLPIILHICGDTTPRLIPVREAGIDIFSVDSIDLNTALSAARGYYTIFGTLSPVNILQNKSAAEVYDIAGQLVNTAGLSGGFILAPGCDLAPDTPLENIQAMVKAARDFTE